jgi:hypothetical protein
MAHGTPLGMAENDERYGATGAFLIEAGISSSYHIAHFFGLTDGVRQPQQASQTAKPGLNEALKEPAKNKIRLPSPAPQPDIAAVLWPHAFPPRNPKPAAQARRFDVGAAITRALTAAGLMK